MWDTITVVERKTIWHHSVTFMLTNATSVVRWAIYKQFVQKIRMHGERNINLTSNVTRGALKVSKNFKRTKQ